MDFTLEDILQPDSYNETDEARPFQHIKIHVTPYMKDGF